MTVGHELQSGNLGLALLISRLRPTLIKKSVDRLIFLPLPPLASSCRLHPCLLCLLIKSAEARGNV